MKDYELRPIDIRCPECSASPGIKCVDNLIKVAGVERMTRSHKARVLGIQNIRRIHELCCQLGFRSDFAFPERVEIEMFEATGEESEWEQAVELLDLLDRTGYEGQFWLQEKS